MTLSRKERLIYGVALPAVGQAIAALVSAFVFLGMAHRGTAGIATEGYLVALFFYLPAAFIAGLVLDGVLACFHWGSRVRLCACALVIGLLPCLFFFLSFAIAKRLPFL